MKLLRSNVLRAWHVVVQSSYREATSRMTARGDIFTFAPNSRALPHAAPEIYIDVPRPVRFVAYLHMCWQDVHLFHERVEVPTSQRRVRVDRALGSRAA